SSAAARRRDHGGGRGCALLLRRAAARRAHRVHRELLADPRAVAHRPARASRRAPILRAMARAPRPLPPGGVRGADLLILLLLGTHEQPFPRAVDAFLALAPEHELTVQHGHTAAREAAGVTWIEFAPYEEILSLCGEADGVFCHAGVGTIMTALAAGKTPVVMPRLARHGEHVDDHQLQIAREFEKQGLVVLLEEGGDPRAALTTARGTVASLSRSDGLKRAVA